MAWTASDNWGAYIADCGPYIGPWPPAPPIPANTRADAEGVEYIVTTGDLASVDTFDWPDGVEVFRYRDGPDWDVNTAIGEDEVTGAHLFVVLYKLDYDYPDTVPAETEFDVVPALYVSGGSGTNVPNPATGHWSEWIDFPATLESTSPQSVTPSHRSRVVTTTTQHTAASTAADPSPLESAAVSELAADSTGLNFSGGESAFGVTVGRNSDPLTYASASGAETDVNVSTAGLDLPDFPEIAPEIGPLIEGIDYAAKPGLTGLHAVEYVGGVTSSFDSWDSTDLALDMEGNSTNPASGAGEPVLAVSLFAFDFVLIDNPAAYPTTAWVPEADGTSVTTETVGLNEVSASHPVAIPLAGVPGNFLINVRWRDGVVPFTDWTYSGLVEETMRWSLALTGSVDPIDANLAYPQFRYWIPGGDVNWHTVGGHFATVGGATLQIKTPGVGWVDVVDGPA